jgi:glycosyltransferase involved in cell wall biosynthesis
MEKKYKIIFLTGSFNMGGAEKHALSLANFYANELKWEVEVWAWHAQSGRVIEICDGLNIKTRLIPKFFKFSKYFYNRQINSYAKILKKENVDIVMSFNNIPNVVATAVKKKANLKLHVWAQQGIDITGKIFNSSREKSILKEVDCVISNSLNGQKYLVDQHNFDKTKISIVQNGIIEPNDITPKNVWQKKLGIDASVFSAVMIANITYMKDHKTLIESWAKVVEKCDKVTPILYFAGRFDTAMDECLVLIKELGLTRNVIFLGGIKDVNGLINAIDLAILSSPTEGVPNAVLESMIQGKPFVGTDIPGIREAVGEENYKYLAPIKDSNLLSELILKFIDSKELREEVGAKNKSHVLETFKMETLYTETHKIIMNELKGNNG